MRVDSLFLLFVMSQSSDSIVCRRPSVLSGMRQQRGIGVLGFIVGLVVGIALALLIAVYVKKMPTPFTDKNAMRTAEQQAAETEKNRGWNPNATLGGGARPAPQAASGQMDATAIAAATQSPTTQPAIVNKMDAQPVQIAATAAPRVPGSIDDAGSAEQQAAQLKARQAAEAQRKAELAAQEAERARQQRHAANANIALLQSNQGATTGGVAGVSLGNAGSANTGFIYFVQAGAFRNEVEANKQQARLSHLGLQAKITERDQAGIPIYRVRLGPFANKSEADHAKARLENNGVDAALVRVQR